MSLGLRPESECRFWILDSRFLIYPSKPDGWFYEGGVMVFLVDENAQESPLSVYMSTIITAIILLVKCLVEIAWWKLTHHLLEGPCVWEEPVKATPGWQS
jgi:hypothetical protein